MEATGQFGKGLLTMCILYGVFGREELKATWLLFVVSVLLLLPFFFLPLPNSTRLGVQREHAFSIHHCGGGDLIDRREFWVTGDLLLFFCSSRKRERFMHACK
jgi:hypothetical protein